MLFNHQRNPETYDIYKAITAYKNELLQRYLSWGKAFSINKTYRLCHENKSILTFSHRIDGWANPVYQLTTNFSVEIKTNFGYGHSSYFYTKLKYKNIEITPFSEWVDYEFAKYSEIIRYTRTHLLENKYWYEAMQFAKDACNLSMTNEVKFVEKYVIEECEKMVSGIEEVFNKDNFLFKSRKEDSYKVDKKGHGLVEFRGEKISGALDFISKIIEFEYVASMKSFINRIEACNKKIQPILFEESNVLKAKISNLQDDKSALQPTYQKALADSQIYQKERNILQKEMISRGQLVFEKIDVEKLNQQFNKNHPGYNMFKDEYIKITNAFNTLCDQISKLNKVYNNINTYNRKIEQYFGKLENNLRPK
ncbi:hypothetical protein [Gelidibacter gilvus]|uniref:Uncharacterized protein n=1 Tax=Gelidibacter gilvus TaxID=59602 RepID=A0A4Q0XL95_9FLAO|nr:hypothetical protein [Gelidibacter gilvus]RXJ51099.1 hypothetical protein ESZ48_04270 [Gelidibacter gilvus]